MGCVQLKQHKKGKNQQELILNGNKQVLKNRKQVAEDPQIIRSLSNISDQKPDTKDHKIRSSNSSKQTGVGETTKMDETSKSNISTKVAPRYPVTIEYVLARKSFLEKQNIPQEHRLNMFPAPKLKGIERSSLYYRRKSTHAEIMRPRKSDIGQDRPTVKSQRF